MGTSTRCRDCNAPMWWTVTEKNKRMPLDPLPVDDGNVVIVGVASRSDSTPLAHVLTNLDREARTYETKPKYKMHRATCGK
jgi:hypothetical protein